jgi:CBS domain containing-hemolysin-like protein
MSFIFGKIPELNEEKEFGGYHFKIIKTANKVVEQVKISELLSADD